MNRHMAVSLILAAGGLCAASRVGGQGKTSDPASLDVFNRTATSLTDGTRTGVRLSARADNGVASPKVSVFVADAKQPSRVVSQLSDRHKGRVGLWVGNGSDGDFANLILTPCPPLR